MKTESRLSFGALLKSYRRAAELSQEALAEKAGYSVVYIRKLESGSWRPTTTTAELLAHALELPESEASAFLAAARTRPGTVQFDRLPAIATPAASVRVVLVGVQRRAPDDDARTKDEGTRHGRDLTAMV